MRHYFQGGANVGYKELTAEIYKLSRLNGSARITRVAPRYNRVGRLVRACECVSKTPRRMALPTCRRCRRPGFSGRTTRPPTRGRGGSDIRWAERKEEPEEEPKREEPKREEPRREEPRREEPDGRSPDGRSEREERGGRRGAVPRAVPGRDACPPCNATAIELGISLYRMLFPLSQLGLRPGGGHGVSRRKRAAHQLGIEEPLPSRPETLHHRVRQDPFVEASLDKHFVPVFLEDTGRADSFGGALGPYGSSMAFRPPWRTWRRRT